MPANHVLLRRITLTDTASSVTFDSIPQTGYTDLKLVHSARTSRSAFHESILLNFNGVTTNRTNRRIYGSNTTAASTNDTLMYGGQAAGATATANTFANSEIYIPNYAGSSFKSSSEDAVSENNAASTMMTLNANLWSSTAAITSITLTPENGGLFQVGSSFSLYGIANVTTTPALAPKADGGDIIRTDGTYWYHAFLSTGTFKPQLNLTADVLVVAGGGGGGAFGGGGGGAGGVVYAASQALSATSYVCTVGSGGTGNSTVVSDNATSGSNSVFTGVTTAIGGGYGAGLSRAAAVGGSGGGGGGNGTALAAGTSGQGTSGGTFYGSNPYNGGGGGGATSAGSAGGSVNGGAGGSGTNTYSAWLTATGLGVSNYIAGGGGGGTAGSANSPHTGGAGGAGGGGAGGSSAYNSYGNSGVAGTANTGSGGGGQASKDGSGSTYSTGGNGGSGVIIIRYPV